MELKMARAILGQHYPNITDRKLGPKKTTENNDGPV